MKRQQPDGTIKDLSERGNRRSRRRRRPAPKPAFEKSEDVSRKIEEQLQHQRLSHQKHQHQQLRKSDYENYGNTDDDDGGDNDVVERKQSFVKKGGAMDPTSEKVKRLGNYRYDEERQVYFPSSYLEDSNNRGLETTQQTDDTSVVSRRDRFSWLFSRQECLDLRHRRRNLALIGCSFSYLERIRLTASAFAYRCHRRNIFEWRTLFSSKEDGVQYQDFLSMDDLNFKIHRPTWLRTLDVWSSSEPWQRPLKQHQPPNRCEESGTPDRRRCSNQTEWQVATLVESGYEIRSRSSHGKTRHEFVPCNSTPQQVRFLNLARSYSIDAQRRRYNTPSALAVLNTCPSVFFRFPPKYLWGDDDESESETIQYHFKAPVNDVVEDSSSTGFLATLANKKQDLFWVVLDRNRNQSTMQVKIRNRVASDVLCMEKAGKAPNSSCSKEFYFGHRNGTISLYDERSPQIATVVGTSPGGGCITSLLPLDNNDQGGLLGWQDRLLLARSQQYNKSHSPNDASCCTLWDLRKPGRGDGGGWTVEYNLPTHAIQRLTNRCNGMAVDRYETTVFAPYVAVQPLEEGGEGVAEIPCLGIWCLLTGEWIGFQKLVTPPPAAYSLFVPDSYKSTRNIPTSQAKGVTGVELCSKVTSAWTWSSVEPLLSRRSPALVPSGDNDGPPPHGVVVKCDDNSSSFGLWYKCGQSPTAFEQVGLNPPMFAGNIHHIAVV